MKTRVLSMVLLFCISSVSLSAAVWIVDDNLPRDYRYIQDAIDAASSGDTIVVKTGYYPETITLKSGVKIFGEGYETTWLNGGNSGTVVTATNVTNAQIDGLAIYGAPNDYGINIDGGSLIVSNCWVIGNEDGILIWDNSSATIRNNLIESNGDSENGHVDYGIVCLHSTPLITNNLIRTNEVGIYMAWPDSAGAKIINNTIVSNDSDGIWCYQEAHAIIKNNIIAYNGLGITAIYNAVPIISYNDVWDNAWGNYESQTGGVAAPGPGDISEDPQFVDLSRYYLDGDVPSPCIDAGDPDDLYDDVDGSRNDMGWTGGPGGNTGPIYNSLMSGFIFTTVGKIPVDEITQAGDDQGLANVSAGTASELSIPQYTDSPFGGNLWIHGLFGPLDTSVYYYRILVAKWLGVKPPSMASAVPLTDSLVKTYYTILSDGTVKAQKYNCGPFTQSSTGLEGFYVLTEEGYWAHRDLRMIWHTGSWANGKYTVFYEAYNSRYEKLTLPDNTQDHFILIVNNTQVEAEIHAVKDEAGQKIQECGMIDLADSMENVQFEITARHPDGYLHSFALQALYGTNKNLGNIVYQSYPGPGAVPPKWYGVSHQTFDSEDAVAASILAPWVTCAYQFRLNVYSRITDGYNYLYWKQFNDHYYVNVGQCAWCGGADVNHDGTVNMVDFARVAERWLDNTCGPTCQ